MSNPYFGPSHDDFFSVFTLLYGVLCYNSSKECICATLEVQGFRRVSVLFIVANWHNVVRPKMAYFQEEWFAPLKTSLQTLSSLH